MRDASVTPASFLDVFDDPRYARLAVEAAPRYQSATPFPHVVFDDFLDPALALELARTFPGPDDIEWVERRNANNIRRFQHDETKLPLTIRAMLREFNARQFILFVETLTGIDNLLPDPYFIGGGPHLAGTNDYLNIHADFNWHHKLQAYRRVNALLYLNPDWREEWAGELELWERDMSRRVRAYAPMFNRLIVFNVADDSHHGQPAPLRCPEGTYRRALNLYFYTTHQNPAEMAAPHFTAYKTQASPHAVELGENYRRLAQAQPS
jgi:hypothetical protein